GVSRDGYLDAAADEPADELPFVGKAQYAILRGQLGRERVERPRQLQDRQRRLIEPRVAAGTADDHPVERAVGRYPHLHDRTRLRAGAAACRPRIVDGADALDLAPPGVEVGCEGRRTRVGRDPQLLALRSSQLRGSFLI